MMYDSEKISAADESRPNLRFVDLPAGRLQVAETGRGPAVILLHGFPEFWFTWQKQLTALAAAGYRALAPDLRGYNASAKPAGVRSYAIEELVGDVVALIEREADGRALLVGHDWGGVIAWRVAALRPDLVARLAILNAPHPAAYRRELRRNPGQWLKSWYMLIFQFPGLAEWSLRRRDFAALNAAFRDGAGRPLFTPAELQPFKEALREPGALTAALNYYRAAFRHGRGFAAPPQEVTVPTLVLWGERDPFLSRSLATGLETWVRDLQMERLPEVGHWVQHEAAERVNERLIAFFSQERR